MKKITVFSLFFAIFCTFSTMFALEIKEQKETESQEKTEDEQQNFNSRADEKLNGIFSGRWNLGLGIAFNTPNKVGLSSGLDFDFKVFSKPYGRGAGNLFIGVGFDLKYWFKTADKGYCHLNEETISSIKNHLINIPIQAKLGYEFKINNPTLRYIGIWGSLGMGIDIDAAYKYTEDIWGDSRNPSKNFLQLSFAWDIAMNMIFKNGFLLNIGFGGNKSKERALLGKDVLDLNAYYDGFDAQHYENNIWRLDHIYLLIGTGVIF